MFQRATPRQRRSQETYDKLLDVAAELLAEVGIERISTNMICARANMTPPALYRYFKNKYAVLEALGMRLLQGQNEVLTRWLETYGPQGLAALGAHVDELIRGIADANARHPGALWIQRALHAVPQLAPIRLASHRYVTDQLCAIYEPFLPGVDRQRLWRWVRLSVEIAYSVDEMLMEEDRVLREDAIADASAILGDLFSERWIARLYGLSHAPE